MKYEKITIIINPIDEEMASYLLFECSAAGLSVVNPACTTMDTGVDTYDYVDNNAFESGISNKLLKLHPDKMFISLFFEKKNGLKQFIKQADTMLAFPYEYIKETVDDNEWINEWKKYYEPFQIGKLWIVPTWKNNFSKDFKIVIDPGIAFGTGQHETTSMILQSMQQHSFENKSVIDIGCGSGILGIASLLLNATSCHFVDVEERAVAICKQNCLSSGVQKSSSFECGYFSKKANECYDIVLANLTASILLLVAQDVFDSLAINGLVFASGIIDGKQNEVKNAYKSIGLTLICETQQNDWHSMIFIKEQI